MNSIEIEGKRKREHPKRRWTKGFAVTEELKPLGKRVKKKRIVNVMGTQP